MARQVPLGEPRSVGLLVGLGLLDFRRLSAHPMMAMGMGLLQAALPPHLPTDGRRVSLTPRVRTCLLPVRSPVPSTVMMMGGEGPEGRVC